MHSKSLLAVSCISAVLCGCNGQGASKTLTGCPQPPVTGVEAQDKIGADIAAKLVKLPIDASFKTNYEGILKADFPKLSDRNVALVLFLRAIDCYLNQKTEAGDAVARELAALVRQEWAAQAGFKGVDGPLTPLEEAYIKRSKFQSEIMQLFNRVGIR